MKTRRESWDEALPATCSALWAVTVSDILTSSEKALWHSVLARVSVVVIKHHDQGSLWKNKLIWVYGSRGLESTMVG